MKYKQLLDKKDAVNKTIVFISTDKWEDIICFKFADNTFLVLDSDLNSVEPLSLEKDFYDLRTFELISQEEYLEYKYKYDSSRLERELKIKKNNLEHLKRKLLEVEADISILEGSINNETN